MVIEEPEVEVAKVESHRGHLRLIHVLAKWRLPVRGIVVNCPDQEMFLHPGQADLVSPVAQWVPQESASTLRTIADHDLGGIAGVSRHDRRFLLIVESSDRWLANEWPG